MDISKQAHTLPANMTKKRKLLLAVAIVFGLADAGYIAWLRSRQLHGMIAEWVAYMPALEKKQRDNPDNFLSTSESHDPDYPRLYIDDANEAYSLFAKLAHDCQIRDYAISRYLGPTKSNPIMQMPDRLFLGKMDVTAAACLRRSLPPGYVLAKLESNVPAEKIGWGLNDLHIAKAK